MEQEKQEQEQLMVCHGIKDAAKRMGLSIELLRRARAHPDCPKSTGGGFADSGRVYVSKDFEKWMADHKAELYNAVPGTLEYWQVQRIKYQTLAKEAELARRQKLIVSRAEAIASFDSIAVAFKGLIMGRFRTQIIDGLQLTPENTIALDAALNEICGVMDHGFDAYKR